MNNEEKNLPTENNGAEDNNLAATNERAAEKKSSGALLLAIIGGAVAVIVAIILLIVLLPGNNGNDQGDAGNDNGGSTGSVDTKTTYTVTVIDQHGDGVEGAMVYFYPEGGIDFPKPTSANGKVDYKTDKNIEISLLDLPEGYDYDNLGTKQSFGEDAEITITVTKLEVETVEYVIKVVDNLGNSIAGVKVQMCNKDSGLCLKGGQTDENGEFVYNTEEANYGAQLSNGEVPEGYSVDEPLAYYSFTDGVATIVLTKN